MDWRREDSGYAAAAIACVAFVAYLLAANFGLVPSPLAPILDGAPPAVAAIEAPGDIAATDMIPKAPPAPASVVRRPAVLPPAPATHVDTSGPAVRFETKDGTSVDLTVPATVKGLANDLGSGVDQVLVTFESTAGKTVVPADVTCAGPGHRSCTWTAKVPGILASYAVTAEAIDRAGNVTSIAPIGVNVVNTGGVVTELGETVGRVPSALVNVVGGLLDVLGLGGK